MIVSGRIALLADVHACREALSACLSHASRMLVDQYIFLGDLVGYGADPVWVMDLAMEFAERGALFVLGNHDIAVAGEQRKTMHADARRVIEWTRQQLDRAHMQFLAGLPLTLKEADYLFVHANAWSPDKWEYIASSFEAARSLAATRQRITFYGHIHDPIMYLMGINGRVTEFVPTPEVEIPFGAQRRWLVNPGAVGQPRDGIPAASYAIVDSIKSTIIYYRVPFDVVSAARKIRAAGLPDNLGHRLEIGL